MLLTETINKLKEKNVRITKVRKALLETFSVAKNPVNVSSILSMLLSKGIDVNKTTVYRELSFLIKQELIKEVYIDPTKIHYESSLLNHHHHLICSNCGKVDDFEIENELIETEKKIQKLKQFKVADHSLEFFGFCANCT